jgi:hypothetical protein
MARACQVLRAPMVAGSPEAQAVRPVEEGPSGASAVKPVEATQLLGVPEALRIVVELP